MSPQEGRHHIQRMVVIKLFHYTKLDQFCSKIETVAALSLDSCHSHVHHSVETIICIFEQIIIAGAPCRIHRIDDTASPLHDRHIAVSPHPPGELLFPATAENQMRMTIHKPRQKRTPASIYFQIIFDIHLPEHHFSRPHMRNNTVRNGNRPILDHTDVRHGLPPLRFKAGTGHHLRCVPYQYLFVFHILFLHFGFQHWLLRRTFHNMTFLKYSLTICK